MSLVVRHLQAGTPTARASSLLLTVVADVRMQGTCTDTRVNNHDVNNTFNNCHPGTVLNPANALSTTTDRPTCCMVRTLMLCFRDGSNGGCTAAATLIT
jgi:hypothetical protein